MTENASASTVSQRLDAARRASRRLALTTGSERESALEAVATAIERSAEEILSANARDIARGRENSLAAGLLDRLTLNETRISGLANAVRSIGALTDPVGEVLRGSVLDNGVKIEQVRVPFGVVGAIYEARPNVTVDIAALALRSGNAVVLRGGSAAIESNTTLTRILRGAIMDAGLPADAIQSIDDFGRDGARELMQARGRVDVLIPRGSASLINTVVAESSVPVIETGAGVVHVYVDADADAAMAASIIVNAKAQRPSVCNAAETLLIHTDAAHEVLPSVMHGLLNAGVTVRGDERARALDARIEAAAPDEWSTEHLELTLGVRIVDSLDEAIEHIDTYSTHHTDAIITKSVRSSERFLAEVDSAVVMVNASTRFTDGGVFGFGAEVGISTQKLHARGPMGLAELTSTKWLVRGDGQVRA